MQFSSVPPEKFRYSIHYIGPRLHIISNLVLTGVDVEQPSGTDVSGRARSYSPTVVNKTSV
jgi:hypothetical protein